MRIHRFFIKDKIDPNNKVTLRAFDYSQILNQWSKVFRYIAGSRVILFDGSGFDYVCLIEKMGGGEAILKVLEKTKTDEQEGPSKKNAMSNIKDNKLESKSINKDYPNITLVMSLIKNENFDLMLQKSTELGVFQIIPVLTERTIKKDLNISRSERILIEDSEQCGRRDVPTLSFVRKLSDVIKESVAVSKDKKKDIVFYACNMIGQSISKALKKIADSKEVVLFVGPEGGWSPKEIKLFEDAKINFIKLNGNTLRAETAAVSALAIISSVTI